ncbi:MAG: hypothetical protein ABI295_08895 [Xanthomarina sp.]
MKQMLLSALIILSSLSSGFAQKMSDDVDISWSNIGGKHKATVTVFGAFKSKDGYIILEKEVIHGPGGYKYFIEVFDKDMSSQKLTDISAEIDERNYKILDVIHFGEKFILVTSRNFAKESREETYIQLLDGTTGSLGERIVIYDQSYERHYQKIDLNFTTSPNKKQLLVQLIPPYKRNEDQKLGFMLFDENLEKKWEKPNISIEVKDKRYSILDVLVNDLGDVYLLGKNFKDAKFLGLYGYSKIYRTIDNTVPFEILYFKDGELVSNAIKLSEIGVIDIALQFGKDNVLHGAGYYSNSVFGTRIDGVLAITVDPNTGELSSVKREEFSKEFLSDGLSERAQASIDKQEKKGKDVGYTTNLKIKEVIQHEDGTVSLVGEVYYVIVSTTTTANGGTVTRYYYHYDDLVVTRISSTGEILSNAKIYKRVVYNSPIGHSVVFDLDNKLAAIFTDNRENLIEINAKSGYKSCNVRVKDKALTITTVGEDGKVAREGVVDYLDNKEHANDAVYKMDYDAFVLEDKEVLLFTYFGKKQFGFLRISPKKK